MAHPSSLGTGCTNTHGRTACQNARARTKCNRLSPKGNCRPTPQQQPKEVRCRIWRPTACWRGVCPNLCPNVGYNPNVVVFGVPNQTDEYQPTSVCIAALRVSRVFGDTHVLLESASNFSSNGCLHVRHAGRAGLGIVPTDSCSPDGDELCHWGGALVGTDLAAALPCDHRRVRFPCDRTGAHRPARIM